jgi:hypothetical protein
VSDSKEENFDALMAYVMKGVDGLVELAKMQIVMDDGGKVRTLNALADTCEARFDTRKMARFIAVLVTDRAVRELKQGG